MRKARRLDTLEADVLHLAESTYMLLSVLTDLVPRDDGSAIRISHTLDQEQARVGAIIDRYAAKRVSW